MNDAWWMMMDDSPTQTLDTFTFTFAIYLYIGHLPFTFTFYIYYLQFYLYIGHFTFFTFYLLPPGVHLPGLCRRRSALPGAAAPAAADVPDCSPARLCRRRRRRLRALLRRRGGGAHALVRLGVCSPTQGKPVGGGGRGIGD